MQTLKHLILLFCFGPVLSLLLPAVCAQDLDNVTISGKVSDQNGSVIPGATITAILVATKSERTVITDGDGNYKLIQMPPGVYKVRASFTNFGTEEKADLSTIAAQNVQLNFVLKPAGITAETVVVSSADTAQVDTTRTIVGGTVISRE